MNELEGEAEKARVMRLQMCEQFLESAIKLLSCPHLQVNACASNSRAGFFEAEELQQPSKIPAPSSAN